jgi:hypothetical protein
MKAKSDANKEAKDQILMGNKTKGMPSLPPHLKVLLDEADREIAANPSNPRWLQKLEPLNWPHLVILPYRP